MLILHERASLRQVKSWGERGVYMERYKLISNLNYNNFVQGCSGEKNTLMKKQEDGKLIINLRYFYILCGG